METIKLLGQRNHVYENWSKTYTCRPELFFEPSTIQEIQDLLALAVKENKCVRMVGGGASPSDICCTNDFMMSMKLFNKVLSVDVKKKQVTVQAGMLLKELNKVLDEHGLAFPVLSAVDCISIGGILGTGVHGSGKKYGIMGSYVTELEFMNGHGDVIKCSPHENADVFKAAIVNLGSLGVVLSVTLQCVPAYNVKQVATSLPFIDGLDEMILDANESSDFQKFLFYPHVDRIVKIDISKLNASQERVCNQWNIWDVLNSLRILELLFYIAVCYLPVIPWLNRFCHYLLFRTPSMIAGKSFDILHFDCLFAQHVTEWAIPQNRVSDFVRELRSQIIKHNLMVFAPIEIRFAKSDEIFLSQCYGRDTAYVNIVMFRPFGLDPANLQDYWKIFVDLAREYEGRPHWGKTNSLTPADFQKLYPKFNDYVAIRKQLDPDGVFVNPYVERHITGH